MPAERHAFMILAHRDQWLLEVQLELLDDPRNDIYLHIDRKSSVFDVERLESTVERARLFLTEQRSVYWGGFSMLEAELLLLRAALERSHGYYHLISGADLPLVTQDTLHSYFLQHAGREFIHYAGDSQDARSAHRVTRKHLFARRGGPDHSSLPIIARRLDRGMSRIQRVSGFDQVRRAGAVPKKGSQWFSVTEDLAQYVIEREAWIRSTFRHGLMPDEFFLQTLVFSSPFRERLFSQRFDDDHWACARKIDWSRGSPYTWRLSDLAELQSAAAHGHIFARKFDSDVDRDIVVAIKEGLA